MRKQTPGNLPRVESVSGLPLNSQHKKAADTVATANPERCAEGGVAAAPARSRTPPPLRVPPRG
jgi:hypothetical protein|eukprot:COSAG06_NODE_728_length_12746_cov_13.586068_11_plen_64_part_00